MEVCALWRAWPGVFVECLPCLSAMEGGGGGTGPDRSVWWGVRMLKVRGGGSDEGLGGFGLGWC